LLEAEGTKGSQRAAGGCLEREDGLPACGRAGLAGVIISPERRVRSREWRNSAEEKIMILSLWMLRQTTQKCADFHQVAG